MANRFSGFGANGSHHAVSHSPVSLWGLAPYKPPPPPTHDVGTVPDVSMVPDVMFTAGRINYEGMETRADGSDIDSEQVMAADTNHKAAGATTHPRTQPLHTALCSLPILTRPSDGVGPSP